MKASFGDFPVSRDEGLLIEHVGDETVIYDSSGGGVHCLTPLAGAVFQRCDGRTSPGDIAKQVSAELGEDFNEDHVQMALAQLEERQLLTVPAGGGSSRREMLKRTAAIAGAAASVPLVSSIVSPASALAGNTGASCLIGKPCSNVSNDCGSFGDGSNAGPPGTTCHCDSNCHQGKQNICTLHISNGTVPGTCSNTNAVLPCCPCGTGGCAGCHTPCNNP